MDETGYNYKEMYEQVISELEKAQEIIAHYRTENSFHPFRNVRSTWTSLSWQERYFAISALCMLIMCLSAIVRDARQGAR